MKFLLLLICVCSGLNATELVYHGSPSKFEAVEPRLSHRVNLQDEIIWEGSAIFATPDRRIALFYTHNQIAKFLAAVDLISPIEPHEPLSFHVIGGRSQEEALNALYGHKGDPKSCLGYIYLLKADFFCWEEGLGRMEVVSRHIETNLGRKQIDRRQEIDSYVAKGLIQVTWEP